MTHAELLPHAEGIVAALEPACVRVSLAGGLRRGKAEPHDAEIVALPNWDRDLFGDPTGTSAPLDECLARLLRDGVLAWDAETPRNGPRYKRLVIRAVGAPLDLFLADEANYGNTLALRTGDADFSRALVTPQAYGGLMPSALRQAGGYLQGASGVVPCPMEGDYFEALGLPASIPMQYRCTAGVGRARSWLEHNRGAETTTTRRGA